MSASGDRPLPDLEPSDRNPPRRRRATPVAARCREPGSTRTRGGLRWGCCPREPGGACTSVTSFDPAPIVTPVTAQQSKIDETTAAKGYRRSLAREMEAM